MALTNRNGGTHLIVYILWHGSTAPHPTPLSPRTPPYPLFLAYTYPRRTPWGAGGWGGPLSSLRVRLCIYFDLLHATRPTSYKRLLELLREASACTTIAILVRDLHELNNGITAAPIAEFATGHRSA